MPQIVISLPDDKLEVLERGRKATGETQSEFLVRLMVDYFEEQRKNAQKYQEEKS